MRDNKLKKLSALFLLSVLVFINAVKTFHTHNFSYLIQAEQANKNATAVKANFFCAICDFQFAKDSDAEVALINISAPIHFIISYYNYTLPQLYNFSVTSSVRGPPSFIC
ncbi:MAG TPA: hypothetical protein VGI61_01225 [Parafilimonas sp.]